MQRQKKEPESRLLSRALNIREPSVATRLLGRARPPTMISAALIWPLLGLSIGSLCGWCGLGLVRLVTRNRGEGWFILGADLVVLLLLAATCLLAYLAGLIASTSGIGLNHAEVTGYVLGVCAFDAGALAGMLSSLFAELSRRRQLDGRPPLALLSRSWLSGHAWGTD